MIVLSPEVTEALACGRPVVALETAITTHGLPPPVNLEVAQDMQAAVREAGAVPATIGLLNGRIHIGLGRDELGQLAAAAEVRKCSTRDLAQAILDGVSGGTTVAATLYLARRYGIRFAATGGIGGVHLGGESSLDISADLPELARSPVVLVSSGPKAILDLERTAEMLETLGVTVVGFRTNELPGFFVARTGIPIASISDARQFVRLFRAHLALGEPASILVVNPPPAGLALDPAEFARLLETARSKARQAGVRGPAETPFLLARLAELSAGRTVRLNAALARANAALAGRLALAVAEDLGHTTLR